MKRFRIVFAVFALLLVLGGVASANFPRLTPPDTTVTLILKQGFYDGKQVWFFCTDSNDINFASNYTYPYRMPTLAAPLSSAYAFNPDDPPSFGAIMYVNTGYQQGPVFTAVPNQPLGDYSGIWSVVFIKWLPGKARLVTNTNPYIPGNLGGFPIISGPDKQADLSMTYGTSRSPVVVDCPIAAVGPLNDSMWPRDNSNPTVLYRLPQVVAFNPKYKMITLPAWYTYCQDRMLDATSYGSFFIYKCTVIIPDVEDDFLADRLGANHAPGLGDIDLADSQDFFFIDGRMSGVSPPFFQFGGPVGSLMKPNQYPILEWAPNGVGATNTNKAYTPVMDVLLLEGGPNFPTNGGIPFANSWPYVITLETAGVYVPISDFRINAPVMGFFRIVRPQAGCSDCP